MLLALVGTAAALSVALLLTLAPARAADPFPAEGEAAIVKIVEDGMAAQRQPGLNVGIWIPGRGEFVRAFGLGDIASKAPMKVDDHIRIASITKTFVAVATLRLVDQGKLKLDDTLATWIEGIPNGERITIRQLLGMRSGIFDFTSDEQFLEDFTADPLMRVLAGGRGRHRPAQRAGLRAGREGELLRHQLHLPRRHRREGERPAGRRRDP